MGTKATVEVTVESLNRISREHDEAVGRVTDLEAEVEILKNTRGVQILGAKLIYDDTTWWKACVVNDLSDALRSLIDEIQAEIDSHAKKPAGFNQRLIKAIQKAKMNGGI